MRAVWCSVSCVCPVCLAQDDWFIRLNLPIPANRSLFATEEKEAA